jgi:hypothetical protein
MNFRFSFVVLLSSFCVPAAFATTTYFSFGTTQPFDLYNGTATSEAGVWNEIIGPGTTKQSIDCINAITNTANVCGNPGPDQSVSINLPSAPGNQGIVPANPVVGATTNYLLIDGDDTYGAPVYTEMTGLVSGATYTISFDQSSTEETPNSQADTDLWQVYVIPGTTAEYLCPTCATPVLDASHLVYSSTPMLNPAGGVTNWEAQEFTFIASAASEVLEFVTDAVITPPGTGAVNPPLLDLAGVTTPETPEPGTWVLTILGGGLLVAGAKLRRRSSTAFRRVQGAHVSTTHISGNQ